VVNSAFLVLDQTVKEKNRTNEHNWKTTKNSFQICQGFLLKPTELMQQQQQQQQQQQPQQEIQRSEVF
jgi:hypothetical protein